jgi:hypothetical protein
MTLFKKKNQLFLIFEHEKNKNLLKKMRARTPAGPFRNSCGRGGQVSKFSRVRAGAGPCGRVFSNTDCRYDNRRHLEF